MNVFAEYLLSGLSLSCWENPRVSELVCAFKLNRILVRRQTVKLINYLSNVKIRWFYPDSLENDSKSIEIISDQLYPDSEHFISSSSSSSASLSSSLSFTNKLNVNIILPYAKLVLRFKS